MKKKDYLFVAFAPIPVLLIPLIGGLVSGEWKWGAFDFVAAWIMVAGAVFVYKFLTTRQAANFAYRVGAAVAVISGVLVTWVNLAVGIIGSEDNPANLLYFGPLLLGLTGVALARFQPAGLARAAFATALAIFLVPMIGFLINRLDFTPGVARVFLFNGFFVTMFTGSGLLFRQAARQAAVAAPTAAA